MDPRHRELAEIALRAAGGGYGLALAGGYAVREHGMGDRPSGDVDLFTDWQRRADFPAAADLVIEASTDNGFMVYVDARADTFARLLVSRSYEPDTEPQKMELAADWRAHPPVTLGVGPVLHPDDAVGNKDGGALRSGARPGLPRHRCRTRQWPLYERSTPPPDRGRRLGFRSRNLRRRARSNGPDQRCCIRPLQAAGSGSAA
jgi:hypothetical protein